MPLLGRDWCLQRSQRHIGDRQRRDRKFSPSVQPHPYPQPLLHTRASSGKRCRLEHLLRSGFKLGSIDAIHIALALLQTEHAISIAFRAVEIEVLLSANYIEAHIKVLQRMNGTNVAPLMCGMYRFLILASIHKGFLQICFVTDDVEMHAVLFLCRV
jgi:hypothetical protein